MFKQTALTSCDSYKLGHADQYPEGTTKVYSNFTPRSESHFNVPSEFKEGKITWFGLQAFLQEMKEIWDETFFKCNKQQVLSEFQEFVAPFVGPRGFDIRRIDALWELGYLPLEIKALNEGVRVPIGVPVLTITNTEPEFYWLPNFMETWMSSELWKSSTSASTSFVYRKIIEGWAEKTGGSKEFIDWQGHDFSVRGMSGIQDAAKSGSGHLVYFLGSDNLPAVKLVNDVYRGKETFVGGSVPATEHSVMCAGGKESEIETFRRLLKTYPSGVVSIVSDTWDFWNVISNYAVQLKDEILNRVPDSLGLAKTVFRPDSGDPVKIICGLQFTEVDNTDDGTLFGFDDKAIIKFDGKYFEVQREYGDWHDSVSIQEVDANVVKGAVEVLWEIFGGTVNDKGYKTLNQRVGLIYGDSITPQRANEILKQLADKGFASDNIVFGIGSYTFQYQTRDTLGFAMKATYVEIEGESVEIFKDPKTDNGTKKSAKGLLSVGWNGQRYVLKDQATAEEEDSVDNELNPVFVNGNILSNDNFANIRNTAKLFI